MFYSLLAACEGDCELILTTFYRYFFAIIFSFCCFLSQRVQPLAIIGNYAPLGSVSMQVLRLRPSLWRRFRLAAHLHHHPSKNAQCDQYNSSYLSALFVRLHFPSPGSIRSSISIHPFIPFWPVSISRHLLWLHPAPSPGQRQWHGLGHI